MVKRETKFAGFWNNIAYQLVMHEMQAFEFAYEDEFHLNVNIYGRWQRHWQMFMEAQFSRIRTWARLWVGKSSSP